MRPSDVTLLPPVELDDDVASEPRTLREGEVPTAQAHERPSAPSARVSSFSDGAFAFVKAR